MLRIQRRQSNPESKLRVVRNCVGALWVVTSSTWIAAWAYLGRYRPTKPQPASGLTDPLPFHGWTVYVRHSEHLLVGFPMWCLVGFAAIAFITVALWATRSEKFTQDN